MVSSKVGPRVLQLLLADNGIRKVNGILCHKTFVLPLASLQNYQVWKRGKILALVTPKKLLKILFLLQIFHRGTSFVEANVANALLSEISKDCHQVLKCPVIKFLSSHLSFKMKPYSVTE